MEHRRYAETPFARRVGAELDARGWGIRTLARRLEPSNPEWARRNLTRWLIEGVTPRSAETRRRVAEALGINPDDFEDDEEAEEAALMAGRLLIQAHAIAQGAVKTP